MSGHLSMIGTRIRAPRLPRGRRGWLGLVGGTAAVAALLAAGVAMALPTKWLELDGNALFDNSGAGATYDWANAGPLTSSTTVGTPWTAAGSGGLFDGGSIAGINVPPNPPDETAAAKADSTIKAAAFIVDPLSSDTTACGSGDPTVFTGQGSETNDGVINTFTYNTGSVPTKDDLSNVYAVAHATGSTNEIYFGGERIDNSGASHIDFEFLQAALTIPNPCGNGSTKVSGHRTSGDILAAVDFGIGGTLAGTTIYQWSCDGTAAGLTRYPVGTTCDPIPKNQGGQFPKAAYVASTNNNLVSIAVNNGSISTGGWVSRDSKGSAITTLPTNAFMEGGIDLAAAGFNGCVTSFWAHTRSSPSITSVLKDFAGPVPFSTCGIHTSTSPSTGTVGQTTLQDTATLTGPSSVTGKVVFNLYPPSDATCSAAPVYTSTVNPATPGTINSSSGTPATGYQPTSAGTYNWTASFYSPASAASPAVTTSCGDEPVTVDKASPEFSTQASPTTDIVVGTPTDIGDAATFTGGYGLTGQSVSFGLYSDATCKTTALVSGTADINASGVATFSSTGWTPTAPGTYYWGVSYAGDANNNSAGPTCGGDNETLTVIKASPSIVTTPSSGGLAPVTVTDSATLSGGYSPSGSIEFKLYGPSATATCTGTPIDDEFVTISGAGTYSTPNGFNATQGGTYWWVASYSGDGYNNAISSNCGDESVVVTVPQSQILPTNTTCSEFASGSAQSLLAVNYTLSDGNIAQGINPGVFFYYTYVTAPQSGPFVISIDQSTTNTTSGELFEIAGTNQIQLYNADCTNSSLAFTTDLSNPAKYLVTVTGASPGQRFILSIKYSTKSIAGMPAPSAPDTIYTFDTDVNDQVQSGTQASITLHKAT